MNVQRGHFVDIMEYKTIPPSNDCACEGSCILRRPLTKARKKSRQPTLTMRQQIARMPQEAATRENPDIEESEDVHIVAQVE